MESIWLVVVDVCGEVRMVVKEKGYTYELGSKLAQLPFPGNGARKLVVTSQHDHQDRKKPSLQQRHQKACWVF